MHHPTTPAHASLNADIHRSGYYPELVTSVLDIALAGEEVKAHVVHVETTFAHTEIKRHITALVLTETRLILAHVDDHSEEHTPDGTMHARAAATTESVALGAITSVVLTHTVNAPERYQPGDAPVELTLAVGWGAVSRVDMEPVQCPDPNCEADHGYNGSITSDDVMIRVSAHAEGLAAVHQAAQFARALSMATAKGSV
ncbi:DUF5998 family protein [Jonesia quinghaiensis]|uniref:DUF5998 family protein n=1 Tax=Jonesia quinghaiensis TaxID=262806 RepID=UPI000402BC63|nr:DUF5998 family protein [Jonesia quinghaiensis]